MVTSLALPTKVDALLTILGEGMVIFVLGLIGCVYPWFLGKPVTTKRYIAIWSLCTTVWVLVAAVFAIKG